MRRVLLLLTKYYAIRIVAMNRQNKTTSGQIENKKELEIESNANKALQYRQHVYILASFCLFRKRYVIIQIAEHGP